VVEASEEGRARIENQGVEVIHPAVPTALPSEAGCFTFEYDMFTRKQ
jgi:hypothetical protein